MGLVRLVRRLARRRAGCLTVSVASCEPLAGERLVAVAAVEAIPMPGLVPEGDAARDDHLLTLGASSGVLVLVALDA